MRKRTLNIALGLALLLVPLVGWGQPQGWHYNAGGRLLGVKSRGNNNWVVGAQGLILHSTDRGDTWNIRESGTTVDLYGVSFIDDQTGWIVGDYGKPIYVLHTTDGGVTWQTQTTINNFFGRGVSFVDALHGWICGTVDTVHKTTDGGATWTQISFNQLSHGTGIVFLDSLHGYMSTDFSTVLKTTDGGQTWAAKNTSVPGLLSIDMVDDLRGWAAGAQIVKTTDGWETSLIQYTPPSGDLLGISIGDTASVWSVGHASNGDIAIIATTTNGGSTWTADTSRTRDNIYYGVDGHLQLTSVTVVGDGGAIVRSTNAGNTWRVVRNVDIGNSGLQNVTFYDANRGWATGGSNITHTTNGGTVWTRQASGVGSTLYGVDFPDSLSGWVCTSGGGVLGTTNGGNSWVGEPTGNTYPLWSIDFVDLVYGTAVGGYYGPPLDSLQGHGGMGAWGHGRQGETALQNAKWTTNSEIASSSRYRGEFLRYAQDKPRNDTLPVWGTGLDFPDRIGIFDWKYPWKPEETVLTTPYRAIIRTTNGGALWIAKNDTGQVPLYGVSFVSRAEGWACGDIQGSMGVILHTTDSGATWQGQTSNVNQALSWIQFRDDALTGWCVGTMGTALWTTDGGNTWNPGNAGTTAHLLSCAFYDNQHGFAGGINGQIIKTADGGRNWQADTSRAQFCMAVSALDSLHAWTVWGDGMVLGWRQAGVSGVETRGQGDKGTRANNSIKAWPNPFVSYARVPGHEKERFALYDITGRRVGTYKGDKIGADATAGVYFLMAEGKEAGPVRIVKIR